MNRREKRNEYKNMLCRLSGILYIMIRFVLYHIYRSDSAIIPSQIDTYSETIDTGNNNNNNDSLIKPKP